MSDHHIIQPKTYYRIFGALMVLTLLTVIVAFFDFGPLNNFVAMGIAVTKATLVILYFMHVRYSTKLTQVVVAGGFFWLLVMFVLIGTDYVAGRATNIPRYSGARQLTQPQ